MENQTNTQETKGYIEELNKAFSSFTSLVKLVEGVTGKELTRSQKQLLSKMTKLSPSSDNTDIDNTDPKWFFSFNFADEAGDVFLVVVDTQSKDWVGIRWTPEGVKVFNKTNGYMGKYTDSYHQYNLKAYPSIKADVVISFNGNSVPFNAETSLSLVEDDGQYRLLASMKIGGIMKETPLIHTRLGTINQSPVLTNLLKRLEAQKHQQPTQPKKENTTMEPTNQNTKVEPVPMPTVEMTGDVTVNDGVILTVTSNMNNKTNIIKWATNCVLVSDPSMEHCSGVVPIHPVVVNKPRGIDSHNQELKCVCAYFMLPIYNNSLTEVKVFLAMTGKKFFRKLVGFVSIGDEIIVMPEVPLSPRMIAEVQILQTLLTTLTDHPELELPDSETKTPCFKPLTPNPIPQPIFNPYGAHPSQQFTQQPPFNSFNPQHPYGPQPSFGPNPYPPQQPYGQDITLMRTLEQLHSLSEKVDLLLKKQ